MSALPGVSWPPRTHKAIDKTFVAKYEITSDAATSFAFTGINLSAARAGDTIVVAISNEGVNSSVYPSTVALDIDGSGGEASVNMTRVNSADGETNASYGNHWTVLYEAVATGTGDTDATVTVSFSSTTRRGMVIWVYILKGAKPGAYSNNRSGTVYSGGTGGISYSTFLPKGAVAIMVESVSNSGMSLTPSNITEDSEDTSIGVDDSSGAVGSYVATNEETISLGWTHGAYFGLTTAAIGVWEPAHK